jgi:tetraacyldisaccharide 4'-kinase
VNWLSGKKLFGFCALGGPESFRKTILSSGAELVGFRTFRDHYKYTSGDMRRIKADADASGADWIATTEKDIIKLRDFNLPDNILIIEVEFSVNAGFYDEVFSE